MSYHHGDLRRALLEAAEAILEQEDGAPLTLRGIARKAGVSHAAPKNHFRNLRELLSELAAEGYRRLRSEMLAVDRADEAPRERLQAIGRVYVSFARGHPRLFGLMFSADSVDMAHPPLRNAAARLFDVLAGAAGAEGGVASTPEVARMVLAWAQVHGLALLLREGMLGPILGRLPPGTSEADLLGQLLEPPPQASPGLHS